MKYKNSTAYAERDNGTVTTIGTYKTREEAIEAMRRFTDRYRDTHVKFVMAWVDDNYEE